MSYANGKGLLKNTGHTRSWDDQSSQRRYRIEAGSDEQERLIDEVERNGVGDVPPTLLHIRLRKD